MRSALSLLLMSYVEERLLGGSNSKLADDEKVANLLVFGHGCASYSEIDFYHLIMTRCFTSNTKIVRKLLALSLNTLRSFID